jgi:signal transduction histidine kinase
LTLYPNYELFEVYSTNNPAIATGGALCIVVFTCILFFMYDFFVRQEFNSKQAVLDAKRQFVRFVSHEVRTPMNTVCMGLALLLNEIGLASRPCKDCQKCSKVVEEREQGGMEQDPTANESQTADVKGEEVADWLELTEEILINAHIAVEVLNDLLNYDKIERGQLTLELNIVPIWSLIERTMSEFHLPAKKKKLNFVLDVSSLTEQDSADPESLSTMKLSRDVKERSVCGDPVRLTQALRNLLSNALKFTPEQGKIIGIQSLLIRFAY